MTAHPIRSCSTPAVRRWPLLLLLLGAVAGCESSDGSRENGDGSEEQSDAVPVRVTEVVAETLRDRVRGVGTLRAPETVEVRPELAGKIGRIHFEEGSLVDRGQLLISIEDRKLQRQLASREATVAAAEARLKRRRVTFNRVRELRKRDVGSPDEFEEAEANFEEAKAQVAEARAEADRIREQIEDTTINAPFTGMVAEGRVDEGDYVEVGELLTTVYRTDEMEIDFRLPERVMGRVQIGQAVDVLTTAFPEKRFEGEVTFVSPAVSESTRDFMVKTVVENDAGRLKPGSFASAMVTVDVRRQRPVIPEESLVATRTGYVAFAVEDGKAQQREITIGLRRPGVVEVRSGLEIGDRVVVEGHMNVSDGSPVRIVGDVPPGSTGAGGSGSTSTGRPTDGTGETTAKGGGR